MIPGSPLFFGIGRLGATAAFRSLSLSKGRRFSLFFPFFTSLDTICYRPVKSR